MGGKKLPTKKEKEAGAKASKNQKEARQHEDAEWKVRSPRIVLGGS